MRDAYKYTQFGTAGLRADVHAGAYYCGTFLFCRLYT